jgi:hypothetical protein
MKINLNLRVMLSLFLITIILFINGCKEESNPITPPSEHIEPEGWLIRDATAKPILVVWQGVIQNQWNSSVISDTLAAPLNALSDHLSIKFLDKDKNIFNPPTSSDYNLGWVIGDTSVLSIVQDSPTDYAFHLKGKKEGNTSLVLQLRHLGHTDARTPEIPVFVQMDTTAHGEPIGIRISYEESGIVLVNATSSSVTGIIEIDKDSTSDHIMVEFYDANGHYFQPEYPLHSLASELNANGIFQYFPETDEPWVFRVEGLSVGTPTLTLKLMVGGTAEFISAPISIIVR